MTPYTIHLENERDVLIRNETLPRSLRDSPLMRYFARPERYRTSKFLDYMERVKLVKTLPSSYAQSNQTTPPRDNGRPPHFVIRKADEDYTVARMMSVSPGNVELFALRLILLERPIH